MSDDELRPWQIHDKQRLYDNKWVQLELWDVEPPGVERFQHHVVRLDHAAIAVVIDDQDRVLMLWRYRFVPGRWGWELPGGLIDPGEDAVTTAMREVEEETGWRPTELRPVVQYQPIVGMVDAPHDVLVGHGATRVGTPTDKEESGRVAWIPLADVPGLMARGELLGSGTLIGLLHVLAFSVAATSNG